MMKPQRNPQNYAFIDSQNLNLGIQKLGWKMNWRAFRQFLADRYHVTKAFMFIGYVPEFESMYEQLHEAGYMVVLKPTFDMSKPRTENKPSTQPGLKEQGAEEKTEDKHIKGNIDADLVLWAMKEMPHYDKALVVSGDGDFYGLVEYLSEQHKLLKLLTPNRYYSNLFNRFEAYIVRLDGFRRQLAYHDRKKATPKT